MNLPENISNVVCKLIDQDTRYVFGGSIALIAVGLINREPKDIDVFLPIGTSLQKNGFLSLERSEITSETVTDTNGINVQRTGVILDGIKCCVFKVAEPELNHSVVDFMGRKMKIQNVNYAIMAKRSYADRSGKHKNDLLEIANAIDKLTNPCSAG